MDFIVSIYRLIVRLKLKLCVYFRASSIPTPRKRGQNLCKCDKRSLTFSFFSTAHFAYTQLSKLQIFFCSNDSMAKCFTRHLPSFFSKKINETIKSNYRLCVSVSECLCSLLLCCEWTAKITAKQRRKKKKQTKNHMEVEGFSVDFSDNKTKEALTHKSTQALRPRNAHLKGNWIYNNIRNRI